MSQRYSKTISVIVPVYNAATFLPSCLNSLCSQTYADLQIIIVDDGSTDESVSIARSFASEDKRIMFFEQHHSGQAAARNLGMKYVKGRYISFVDADDYIAEDYLETMVNAINGYDIVQTGYTKVNADHQTMFTQLPKNKHQFTSACMRLYKRDILSKISFQNGIYYEDILFSADLWSLRPSIHMLDNCGYFYTLNQRSTTSTSHPQDKQSLFHLLHQRLHKAGFSRKFTILYTIVRARMYFIFQN